jgi:hypothetical protein
MVKKKSASKSRGGAERPSQKMLTQAAKTLSDPNATAAAKRLAAVVLGEARRH